MTPVSQVVWNISTEKGAITKANEEAFKVPGEEVLFFGTLACRVRITFGSSKILMHSRTCLADSGPFEVALTKHI